jgi:rhodanese-related sulfurtransferase
LIKFNIKSLNYCKVYLRLFSPNSARPFRTANRFARLDYTHSTITALFGIGDPSSETITPMWLPALHNGPTGRCTKMRLTIGNALLGLFTLTQALFATADPGDAVRPLEGATLLRAEELLDMMQALKNLRLIDNRVSASFEQGYISGSYSLPYVNATPQALTAIAPDKSIPLVFYCDGPACLTGLRVAKKALGYGYANVFWFKGGIEEWRSKGLPLNEAR